MGTVDYVGGKQMLQGDKNKCAFDTPSEGDGGLQVCPLSCPPFINVTVLITASFIKPLTARIQTCLFAPALTGRNGCWLGYCYQPVVTVMGWKQSRWQIGLLLSRRWNIFSFPPNANEVRSCAVGAGYLPPPPQHNPLSVAPLRARHQS